MMNLSGSEIMLPEWSQALILEPHETYHKALLGYQSDLDCLIYNEDKIIDILITQDNMDLNDAIEFFEYNIRGSHGENHPIYAVPAR